MNSTTLRLTELNLDKLKLLDRVFHHHFNGTGGSTSSNNFATRHTFTSITPGWYLICLSFASGSSTGVRARLYDSVEADTIASVSAGTDIGAGGEDMRLVYLEGNNLDVQTARASSVGGHAVWRCLHCFMLMISDDQP